MDLLKRELAPILPQAWDLIDREARQVLEVHLAARKLVDFKGPYGWEYASVNTGRLDLLKKESVAGVRSGLRRVQPLLELRVPVQLEIMELDSIGRGGDDPDLNPIREAAEQIARAEDSAIFNGYPEAGIAGIIPSSPHKPIPVTSNGVDYPHIVVQAKEVLRQSGISGPYALALGPKSYNELSQAVDDGYPIRKRIEQIISGPIVWAPSIDGAVLLSIRGGDFELTVGQDLSVGYAYRDKHSVELYITESFTFRVLEPLAAVHLKRSTSKSEK